MTRTASAKRLAEVPRLVGQLNRIVRRLEKLFDGRSFTLDGHLVGSIGEIVAAFLFDLELTRSSTAGHDARARDGRRVEIKLTQGRTIGLRSCPRPSRWTARNPSRSSGPGKPAGLHADAEERQRARLRVSAVAPSSATWAMLDSGHGGHCRCHEAGTGEGRRRPGALR